MAVYGYVRVSTAAQVEAGQSLGVQQRQLEGYGMQHGLQLAEVFVEEGVSGSIPLAERPEGARMMARLRKGDVVVASKLDRVFRSSLDALQMVEAFKRKGVALHLLDLGGDVTGSGSGSGMAKLFLAIAAAFAEAERDRVQERIVGVKADQRKRNRYLGGKLPFGHVVGADGELVVVPEHQPVIEKIKRLRAEGATLRAIRGALALDGVALSLDAISRIGSGT